MSRVFLPQRPVVKNYGTASGGPRWLDKYDLSPAERFGPLVELLPIGNSPSDLGSVMRHVEHGLRDFSADDHLLAVGDPVVLAIAVLVAARRTGGQVSLLKWDRLAREYSAHRVSAA